MSIFVPQSDPDLTVALQWFEFQTELITAKRSQVFASDYLAAPPFLYMTREEIEEFFSSQRTHLELLAMFDLLATAEAMLRLDFLDRVSAKKKDPLSRRYRDVKKDRGDQVRLDEDILESLKQEGLAPRVVGAFRGTLKLRNWLAHGRHWNPKLGQNYAPNDLFDIAKELIEAIPGS